MSINSSDDDNDYTLAVIRRLTRPLIQPPTPDELPDILQDPWPMRVAVSPTDYTTLNHWKGQARTSLFRSMFEWPEDDRNDETKDFPTSETNRSGTDSQPTAHLHPFFSFGDPSSPFFFNPWQDIGNCLRNLLLHRLASHQALGHDITLSSHDTDLFVATGSSFAEEEIDSFRISPHFYMLRCHHDTENRQLLFGYHDSHSSTDIPKSSKETLKLSSFHPLLTVSLSDENWRLTTCILLKNIAQVLSCLIDFAIPLVSRPEKLSVITTSMNEKRIQKVYNSNYICNIFNATVDNMIDIYERIKKASVPHTDQIMSVEYADQDSNHETNERIVVQFAPIGRSYLPENFEELMDALICVAQTLTGLGELGIMHRDIRWANVFHALDSSTESNKEKPHTFTREWVLFDFEYAAYVPQEAFPAHTLTPENHAPEMILHNGDTQADRIPPHDTSVDIWGLGFLIQHAKVDVPESHAAEMMRLQSDCLQTNPNDRPTATECLKRLLILQARPRSINFEMLFQQMACV